MTDLLKSIVIFFSDEHFIDMVVPAITTLLSRVDGVSVGLLTPSKTVEEDILTQLPPDLLSRVLCRTASVSPPHFENWNPTQYKLDICKFLDYQLFDTIFWMDADTLTFNDLSPLIGGFIQSKATFLMTKDHVNFDQRFLDNWRQQNNGNEAPPIPQSCFMGFRAEHLKEFLAAWKQEWRNWITPTPFPNQHPDPRPHFKYSSFCIEQYALGIALQNYRLQKGLTGNESVMWFERIMLEIPKSSKPQPPKASEDQINEEAPSTTGGDTTNDINLIQKSTLPSSTISGSSDLTSLEAYSSCSYSSSSYYFSSNSATVSFSESNSTETTTTTTATRTKSPPENRNIAYIDKFPGFLHYYHENKQSAFEFWRIHQQSII